MIVALAGMPENVLALEARGVVTAADYRDVVAPALERLLERHTRVRLLYLLGSAFEGYTAGAGWEDGRTFVSHMRVWDRCAIVSDVTWVRDAARMLGWLLPGEFRLFGVDQLDDARAWVTG